MNTSKADMDSMIDSGREKINDMAEQGMELYFLCQLVPCGFHSRGTADRNGKRLCGRLCRGSRT